MLSVLDRCFILLHGQKGSSTASEASGITKINISEMSAMSLMLGKHMKRYVYDLVRTRLTKLDHNFYDILWPSVKKLPQERAFRIALEQDFPIGIVAPDFYVYKTFSEYLEPLIKEVNNIGRLRLKEEDLIHHLILLRVEQRAHRPSVNRILWARGCGEVLNHRVSPRCGSTSKIRRQRYFGVYAKPGKL